MRQYSTVAHGQLMGHRQEDTMQLLRSMVSLLHSVTVSWHDSFVFIYSGITPGNAYSLAHQATIHIEAAGLHALQCFSLFV